MNNYLVSQEQFYKIFKKVNEVASTSSIIAATRKIVTELKKKEFEDEEIVDIILQIRYKDPYTIFLMKKNHPELSDEIEILTEIS